MKREIGFHSNEEPFIQKANVESEKARGQRGEGTCSLSLPLTTRGKYQELQKISGTTNQKKKPQNLVGQWGNT